MSDAFYLTEVTNPSLNGEKSCIWPIFQSATITLLKRIILKEKEPKFNFVISKSINEEKQDFWHLSLLWVP